MSYIRTNVVGFRPGCNPPGLFRGNRRLAAGPAVLGALLRLMRRIRGRIRHTVQLPPICRQAVTPLAEMLEDVRRRKRAR